MEVGVPVDAPYSAKNEKNVGPAPEIGLGLGVLDREEPRETHRVQNSWR